MPCLNTLAQDPEPGIPLRVKGPLKTAQEQFLRSDILEDSANLQPLVFGKTVQSVGFPHSSKNLHPTLTNTLSVQAGIGSQA